MDHARPTDDLSPPAIAAQPLRVLILMSRTGGGHLASARALEAELQAQRPGTEVLIVDLLTDHISRPFSFLPKTYDTIVNRAPRLWHALWRMTARARVGGPTTALVSHLSRPKLERLLADTRPDLVISVHPLVNHLMLPILARVSPSTRYMTVVTDLGGIHPLWLHPDNSAIYLPTERAVGTAIGLGLPRSKLHAHGLPVRADFAREPGDRAEARAGFGLDPALPVVLVIGGGGGIGPIEAIVEATAEGLARIGGRSAQIAVVCAKNAKLKADIECRRWPVPVTALGYVDGMSDLMHGSDLIVTKAGPGTIAEASIRGLPMALYGYIPGQEAANVDHVVEAGAGFFEPQPGPLGAEVARLMTSGAADLARMAAKAAALGRAQATRDIVASILAAV